MSREMYENLTLLIVAAPKGAGMQNKLPSPKGDAGFTNLSAHNHLHRVKEELEMN